MKLNEATKEIQEKNPMIKNPSGFQSARSVPARSLKVYNKNYEPNVDSVLYWHNCSYSLDQWIRETNKAIEATKAAGDALFVSFGSDNNLEVEVEDIRTWIEDDKIFVLIRNKKEKQDGIHT